MKRFVAIARVSSREQEREGFSLEVQEDALREYARREKGDVVKLFRIAETASKADERKTFRELVRYAKKNSAKLDGLLFYKVDRAARNLFDYVELERLESEYGVPFISVSQPTENSPAGRMMRRTLANMASFYTEQQSVDVKEGIARRVQEGWFPGKAPYGYLNVRINGRSIVQIDPEKAPKVKRLFHLFAYEHHTLDSLCDKLDEECIEYLPSSRRFTRSKVHTMLRDRSYIGEVFHRGNWHPGNQEHLVDAATWNRVQRLLGSKVYKSHELTYAGSLIRCSHCGNFVTGEKVRKKTKHGENVHVYYRCSRYQSKGHPRVRVKEADIESQVLDLFKAIRIEDDGIRDWFAMVLRSQTRDSQDAAREQRSQLQRQLTNLAEQQSRLLNLRLMDEIDADTFAKKRLDLRDREAELKLQVDVTDRSQHEMADLACKVFELSQTLTEKWLTAEYAEKRRILEIVCLNLELDGASLCIETRKPFDVLAKGHDFENSRGERI